MKVAVTFPVRDSKVHFMNALSHAFLLPFAPPELEVELAYFPVPGQANIPRARNQGVAAALAWGARKIWLIDDDISFDARDVWRITARPEPFIVGLPQRRPASVPDLLQKPMIMGSFKDNKPVVDSHNGMCKALKVPTAFMCLDREVFERRKTARTDRYEPAHKFSLPQETDAVNEHVYGYFSYSSHSDFEFADDHHYGEDYFFSNWWRETGGTIWADPKVRLGHHDGLFNFNLSLGDILQLQKEAPEQVKTPKEKAA